MEKRQKIYEGKAKILYTTDDPDRIIQYFKDDATAFNAQKKGTIQEKGILNNRISSRLFTYLEERGIRTHFMRQLSDREMLVKTLQIVPVEVVVRNIIAGSLAQRMGMPEGGDLKLPVLEFYYKKDELGDPMINESHIAAFDLAKPQEISVIREVALAVNRHLTAFFEERGILLVDFKLEFGRHKGEILLGDEITPDGCRLWDRVTREKMDKDRFRRDLGKVEEAYQEVYRRVCQS
ncbi:MAG: phosphoribosylaminoimidazolesuccinocarboxamide synthase [Candidatus Tectomicrobia bacterium]|uniref:Phosphoribosylaminoimidazole-succinocarboxamide synthase n=1 Tax=Tectimicrobiota bacterium TaxID=2528274 RepID=A0A932GQZ1_UNCTE|nr:phosphoribosylaminoimidazolesuccinocarboxamide synthase [Candidatus Tectomicrobia bacterium]